MLQAPFKAAVLPVVANNEKVKRLGEYTPQ